MVLYFTNLPRCSIAVHDHVSSAALVAAGVAIVMVTTVMVTVARAAVAGRGLAAAAARGAVLAVPETRKVGLLTTVFYVHVQGRSVNRSAVLGLRN